MITLAIRYEYDDISVESSKSFELTQELKAKQLAEWFVDEWFFKADLKKSAHILITSNEADYWSDIECDMLGQPGVFDCRKLTEAQQRRVESFINHVVHHNG
jgi:hypothetical protein